MKNKNVIFISIVCYVIALMFYSFDPLMQSFPSVLMDPIMKTFATSSVGVGVVAASYFYSYNLMQIPAGILCDKVGTKTILMIASIICIVGLLLFANADSLNLAILSRVLMGLGASCAAVILVLVSKQYFDEIYLPLLVGIAQFFGNIGSICGQLPLSIASNAYGWRFSVSLLTIIPISILIGTVLFIKKSSQESIQNRNHGSIRNNIKKILRNKKNWLIALYAVLLWTPFYTFSSLWGIPFLRTELDISVENASALMTVAWLGSGVGSILIGVWSSYIGKRKICMLVSALLGVIIFSLILVVRVHDIAALSIFLFLFGCASAGQALSFALISDNNQEELGTAVGFLNTMIMMGPMLLDPMIGWLLKSGWDKKMYNEIPVYSISDYKITFILIPILFICAAIISLFYNEKAIN